MKEFYKNHQTAIEFSAILILCTIVGLVIVLCLFTYANNFYSEDEIVLIEVIDKRYDEDMSWNPATKTASTHYNYYLVWEEGNLEVSESVYYSTNIGDRIVITKTTIKEKETGKVNRVYYSYGND